MANINDSSGSTQSDSGGNTSSNDDRESKLRDVVEEDQQRSEDLTGDSRSSDSGNDLSDAERQNMRAGFEREVDGFGQGDETNDPQAREFEEEITSTDGQLDQVQSRIEREFQDTSGYDVSRLDDGRYRAEIETDSGTVSRTYGVVDDPSEVKIVRDGDQLRAEYTAAGREAIGANPTDREIREQIAAETGYSPSDFRVTRDGDNVSVTLTDRAADREYNEYLDNIQLLAGVRQETERPTQTRSGEFDVSDLSPEQQDEYNERVIEGMSLRTVQRRSAAGQRRQNERDFVSDAVRTGTESFFASYFGRKAGDELADRTFDRVDTVGQGIGDEFGAVQRRAQEEYYGIPGVPNPEEADAAEQSFYGGLADFGNSVLDSNRKLEQYVEDEGFRTGPGPLALFPAAPSGINAPSRVAGTVNRFRGTTGLRNIDPVYRATNVGAQTSRGVAATGGSASGGSTATNIVSRLNARDAALIAGGIGAASTQVNVPENNDVFGPEFDVTGEFEQYGEIEVPTDGDFGQGDISVPEDPTATQSELTVVEDPAFGQPELAVSEDMGNAGLTLSQLVEMPLSEQLERRRRERVERAVADDELSEVARQQYEQSIYEQAQDYGDEVYGSVPENPEVDRSDVESSDSTRDIGYNPRNPDRLDEREVDESELIGGSIEGMPREDVTDAAAERDFQDSYYRDLLEEDNIEFGDDSLADEIEAYSEGARQELLELQRQAEESQVLEEAARPRGEEIGALGSELEQDAESEYSLLGEALRPGVRERSRLDPGTLNRRGLGQRELEDQLLREQALQQQRLQRELAFEDEFGFQEQTQTNTNQFEQAYDYQYGYESLPEYAETFNVGFGPEPPERPRGPDFDGDGGVDVFQSGQATRRNPGRDPFLTFGYVSETFEGFAEGGLEPVEAPSQDVLAELSAETPGADLPTQDILSGDVDVDYVRDFFTLDEVEP